MGKRSEYEKGWFDCYRQMKRVITGASTEITQVRKDWSRANAENRTLERKRADRGQVPVQSERGEDQADLSPGGSGARCEDDKQVDYPDQVW